MDDFEKIRSEVEREGIEVNRGLSKMLLAMWENARQEIKACTKNAQMLFFAAVAASILAAAAICGCIYLGSVVHQQAGEIQAIQEILDAGVVIEETTTTTTEEVITQSVDGDSATINNGSWEQYNDNSVNNGGGD